MIHRVEDWIRALPDLRRSGAEWVGPCPACGGTDRFRVRAGATQAGAVIACRHCLDGQEAAARRGRYSEIVQAVFGDSDRDRDAGGDGGLSSRPPPAPWTAPEDGPASGPGPGQGRRRRARQAPAVFETGEHERGDRAAAGNAAIAEARDAAARAETEAKTKTARAIWDAAAPAPDGPAETYLVNRMAWPPAAIGPGRPSLPGTIRYLARDAAPGPGTGWPGLPPGAAGAVVYGMADVAAYLAAASRFETAIRAVHLEALDGAGDRLAPRWRRIIGAAAGRVFQACEGEIGGDVILAEGPVDALAIALRRPAARTLAVVGRDYRPAVRAVLAKDRLQPILIETDGGGAGQAAAAAARTEARRLGCRGAVRAAWRRPGDTADPGDELVGDVQERAAILEYDGGLSRAAAEAAAWQSILGATTENGNAD